MCPRGGSIRAVFPGSRRGLEVASGGRQKYCERGDLVTEANASRGDRKRKGRHMDKLLKRRHEGLKTPRQEYSQASRRDTG